MSVNVSYMLELTEEELLVIYAALTIVDVHGHPTPKTDQELAADRALATAIDKVTRMLKGI